MNRARGFLMLDIVGGLLIVTVLTIALATAVGEHGRSMSRLADSREALRLAERAMVEIQRTGATRIRGPQTQVRIEGVPGEGPPAGWRWAKVAVQYRRGSAELVGLVPASAAEVRP
jgi:hypothetical protein